MAKIYCVAVIVAVVALSSFHGTEAVKCVADDVTGGFQDGCAQCQKKTVGFVGVDFKSSKSCQQNCAPQTGNIANLFTSIYCCNNVDLCNAASSVKVSLLGAAVTSLLALWYLRV